ncbi:MAG: hypothetical protein U1E53_08360 [Dongiaceae bacterium]
MLELDPLAGLAPLTGSALLRELATLLPMQGVPFPPVPTEMVDAVRMLGRWQFGTRPLRRALLDIDLWVSEAAAEAPAAYLVFGHDGHGIAGQAIHYYLVVGHLALFLQEGLDTLADTPGLPMLAAAFAALPNLLERFEQARTQGLIDADERWVLVDSDRAGQRWARLTGSRSPPAWQDRGRHPIAAALSRLRVLGDPSSEAAGEPG